MQGPTHKWCTHSHRQAKAGRVAGTYMQQLCADIGCGPDDLPEAMDDREGRRERVRDICADIATWWWWWWWSQVFLFNTNNLHTVVLFQVFLSNTNNLKWDVCFQVFLSKYKKLLTVIWFQVFLPNTNNSDWDVCFQVFFLSTKKLLTLIPI